MRPAGIAASLLFAGLCVVGGALGARGEGAWSETAVRERFPDPDASAKGEDYLGHEECEECHEDRGKSLRTSFHAGVLESPGSRGCEACHGPGLAHADEGGDGPIRHPGKAGAAVVAGACLRCHAKVLTEPVRGHRDWISNGGEPRSCTACHAVHVDRSAKAFADLGPFGTVAALEGHAAYVPAKRCIACHAEFHPEMARSGHAPLLAEGKTCGTCHGPGGLHADSGGDRRKIVHPGKQRPGDVAATCRQCHGSSGATERWTCAEHHKEGVSCIVCHDANGRAGRTVRGTQMELCGSCHADVAAKLRLPNRHRVEDGRVECTDCHDPHGNESKVRDLDLRYRTCLECHGEKGGPFLFDHGIKRTEGCVACHDPHGSANRRMLAMTRTKPLCVQCHPETPHDLSSPRYSNCLSCHSEIHGSDLDRRFLR